MQKEVTLVILDGETDIHCYSLSEDKTWTFGRESAHSHPDISVQSKIVSRTHGEFESMDGEWFYVEKESKNGTYHNGKKIRKGLKKKVRPVLLSDGDILRIDSEDLNAPDSRGVRILFLTEQAGEACRKMSKKRLMKMVMEYEKKEN
ncbi:MAG: FHA domain-containing protein [Lachnospiraceae bacterium]